MIMIIIYLIIKFNFKNNLDLLGKEINIRHIKHLITYQSNQCIGFECFYYGINYLYTAIAMTKEVKIYRIKIKHLIEVLNDKRENNLKIFGKKAENKINLLLERFTLINNDLMKFYDTKILNKNKSKEEKLISKSPELIINKKDEEKENNKILVIKKIFKDNRKNKINKTNSQRRFSKIINYLNLKNKILLSESNKKLKYNFSEIKEKDFNKSNYNYKIKNKYNDLKSIENQIYKKLIEKDFFQSKLEFSNYKLNKEIKKNKTIDSLSPINKKNNNIFISSQNYHKVMNKEIKNKLLYNKSVKNKNLMKKFEDNFLKGFAYNSSYINHNYKYDFRKTLNANKKLFKYSIFNFTNPPKNNNYSNFTESQLYISNTIHTNRINKNNNFPQLEIIKTKNDV